MTPRVMRASACRTGALGPVEIGTGPDDFAGECFGHAVLGEVPVAVHHVEVVFGRVDHEVMVQVIRGTA